IVEEAIEEVVLREAFKAEILAAHIAERIRDSQGGLRAEVRLAARYPEHKPAPVSGIQTQEIYRLLASAVASERGTRRLSGVDELRDLRADEALRRGPRGGEGAPPAALRRGLRARDGPDGRRGVRAPRRGRIRLGAAAEPRDDPPARRGRRAPRPARGSRAG